MARAKHGKIHRYAKGEDPTQVWIEVKQRAAYVALLLDENYFKASGDMIHHVSVFYLDLIHDYDYKEKDGKLYLRVYGSVDKEEPLPIVIVYTVH